MKDKLNKFVSKNPKATSAEILEVIYDDIINLKNQGKSWSNIMDEISFCGVFIGDTAFYRFIENKKKKPSN